VVGAWSHIPCGGAARRHDVKISCDLHAIARRRVTARGLCPSGAVDTPYEPLCLRGDACELIGPGDRGDRRLRRPYSMLSPDQMGSQ